MIILSPKEIAKKLKKSLRWVYSNAANLGAARIGGSWIFTEEGLIDGLQRGQEISRNSIPSGQKVHVFAGNKKGREKLGDRKKEGTETDLKEAAERHGLTDLM